MADIEQLIAAQNSILTEIAKSLNILAGAMASAPDIRQPIDTYTGFDWSSIGATVLRSDQEGASVVEWNGKIFKRRAPDNKFDPCIWYSRCNGKKEDGSNNYDSLISFERICDNVEPIGEKARRLIPKTPAPSQSRPPVPPPAQAQVEDPLPDFSKTLSDDEMDERARRFVAGNMVVRVEGGYKVTINPKMSHLVTRPADKTLCNCESFKALIAGNPEFRCEHVRAVAFHYRQQVAEMEKADKSQPKTAPDRTANQLAIEGLITAIEQYGVGQTEISGRIARISDGKTSVGELNQAEEAKVLTALNNWVSELEYRQLRKGA